MSRATDLLWSFEMLALAALPVQTVVASEFLSADAARLSAFPQADRFEAWTPALTPTQQQRIAALAGPQPPHGRLQVWRAWRGSESLGYFFVDEVVGRQDFITYSLSIDAQGRLGTPEILSYRESHGGEVRSAAWRRQFAGRSDLAALHPATDIRNIAGATLSCEHLTQGVRQLLALWQVALAATP